MGQNHYRLLVLDIDGTLVDRNGNVSSEDREALDMVRAAGIRVSLSTGRSFKACLRILKQLSLDSYHIFFDGAVVGSHDLSEEVCVQPLEKTMVREVTDFARNIGMDIELFSTTDYFACRENWATDVRRQFFAVEAKIVDFRELCEEERIVKGGLVSISSEEDAVVAEFARHFAGRLNFSRARTPAYPGVTFSNILAPQVSKGRALEILAAYLGVSLDEVMAVGDGSNDVSLIQTAGLGIAMGNAEGKLKEVADYVTLDVDRSGLAVAIRKFLL